MKRQKHGILRLCASAIILSLVLLLLPSCSSKSSDNAPVSTAINSLCLQNSMAKSTLKGEEIKFSALDFARALNVERVDSVCITQVPPKTDGSLRVGSTLLSGKQTLSAASLSLMTFSASEAISCSEFKFTVNDLPYEMTCKLYMLDEINYAPTLSSAPKTASSVSIYENVTYFGTIPCYDADGDETFIEIVSYPEKGILILDDRATGAYRYLPDEDTTGKDSFVCIARDIYGNYSPSMTVSLEIKRTDSSARFVDLLESPYHNAALCMSENGIMSGTRVGSLLYFYPDREITRAEFTMMAMNAIGITEVNPTDKTVFADDGDIPENMKSFICAAYDLGYIKGTVVDEKLCFLPQKTITRAEAAVMLSNMLDSATPTYKPVFDDSEEVPAWAATSLSSLCAMGVFMQTDNKIEPMSALTRGDAAVILSNFIEVRK